MKKIGVIFLLATNVLAGDFGLYLENDLLHETDRHYTHGTKFSYETDTIPSYLDNLWKDKKRMSGWTLAQHMYTPSDIKTKEYIPDDRPYGGWLYVGEYLTARDGNWMDFVELDFGVTGPPSLSEETQTLIHHWVGSAKPMGWKHQIKFEPGLDLSYQKKYRWRYQDYFDVIPQGGGCLGNIFTYASVGTMARLGYNIPDDFGYLRVEPAPRIFQTSPISIYIFTGAEERYVLRNIFLDGNTFVESHHIAKEDFVTDLNYGAGIILWNLEVIFSDNYRTKEFIKQKENNRFSTALILWRF